MTVIQNAVLYFYTGGLPLRLSNALTDKIKKRVKISIAYRIH